MSTDEVSSAVATQYDRRDLLEAIQQGLLLAGFEPSAPTLDQLTPVDEFHTGGLKATRSLFALMDLQPHHRVLDAGCGLGGASRRLAAEYGCTVTGVDLVPTYVEVATALTKRTGLDPLCRFETANLLRLPFEDASFDKVVTLHAAMNINARDQLYRELARVLVPNGCLGLFDVMKGPIDGMRYPVPWAETAETSFLSPPPAIEGWLRAAGFQIDEQIDYRDQALAFFDPIIARFDREAAMPALGIHLVMGLNTPLKLRNFTAALRDHQVTPVMMIASKR